MILLPSPLFMYRKAFLVLLCLVIVFGLCTFAFAEFGTTDSQRLGQILTCLNGSTGILNKLDSSNTHLGNIGALLRNGSQGNWLRDIGRGLNVLNDGQTPYLLSIKDETYLQTGKLNSIYDALTNVTNDAYLSTISQYESFIYQNTLDIPLIKSSVDSNTQTVSNFYSYFSESSSPVTFRYHYRSAPSAALSRSSTTSEVAYLTASSGNRKMVETYSGSSLSFFDRLSLLNNNVVTLGTELLTPSTSYSLVLSNYATDTSTDFSFVSIGDFLHYLGRSVDPLRRLSYVLADDDDIDMKRDTQAQRDYLASLYADGGSAPSVSDMSDVNDDISSLNDIFSVGNQDIGQGVTDLNRETQRFWSSEVYNDVNAGALRSSSRSRSSSSEIIDFYSDWISGWSD